MISVDTSIGSASFKLKLFWFANLIASISLGVYLVAFNWLVVKSYGAYGISVTTIAYAIPQTTLVLFGGLTSDSINKESLYKICQILYVAVGIVLLLACINDLPPLWFLGLVSFASGLTVAFSSPNKTSLISSLVPETQITSIQQLFFFATGLGWVLGSVLASHLLSWDELYFKNSHGVLAFLFYILGLIPSIFCVPKILNSQQVSIAGNSLGVKFKTALSDISAALLYIRTTFDIRVLIWMLAIVLILGMPFSYLLSIYAHAHPNMHQSSKLFAHLFAALGVGNILGALLGIHITKSHMKQATLFVYIIFGLCFSAIAALLMTQYWQIVCMILLAGLFSSLCTDLLKGLIQSQTNVTMRGRIAGFTQLLAGISTMSAGLAGFVVHHLSNHETNTYSAYVSVQLVLLGLLAILTLLSLPSILKTHIRI